jgi:hypothetical protein
MLHAFVRREFVCAEQDGPMGQPRLWMHTILQEIIMLQAAEAAVVSCLGGEVWGRHPISKPASLHVLTWTFVKTTVASDIV